MPCLKAAKKISTSGANKNAAMNATDAPINTPRIGADSVTAGEAGSRTALTTRRRLVATVPALERVDREQHDE